MSITQEISGKIAAIDAAIDDFDCQAGKLSLAAVRGDGAASKSLVLMHRKIVSARIDRELLVRARAEATEVERAAEEAAEATARAEHTAAAREHVRALLSEAGRADGLLADIKDTLAKLGELERLARTEAIAARGVTFSSGRVGQSGIASMAKGMLGRIIEDDRFGDPRPLTHWISVGWAELLATNDEGAAA